MYDMLIVRTMTVCMQDVFSKKNVFKQQQEIY